MKRISVVTLTTLGLVILACGGGGGGGEDVVDDGDVYTDEGDEGLTVELPNVPITEPWASMSLPTSGGQVVLSDPSVLLVGYENGSVTDLTKEYTTAIAMAGYAKKDDYSTPDFTAILFEKDAMQIGFASGTEQGIAFAYMEDLGKVSEDQSTIAAARKGTPKLQRAGNLKSSKTHRTTRGSGAHTPRTGGGKKTSGDKKSSDKKSSDKKKSN